MNKQKSNVVVTGATGWLGRNLIEGLINGLEVCAPVQTITGNGTIRAFVRPGEDVSVFEKYKNRVEIVYGDVRSKDDCRALMEMCNEAILFHTAGVVHPKKVSEFYEINTRGTENVLNAAESSGLKRAVVVSSNSPIGCNSTMTDIFDENTPFNPYMGYGRSKMMMEQLTLEVQARGVLETVRIRAPWFYGPFQPERQGLFFRMVRDGKAPIVGGGYNIRSMAYMDNLVQGLMLAAITPIANGKVYWIADEKPYSMNEIIDTIESVLETDFGVRCSHRRLKLPSVVSDIAWLFDKNLQSVGIYQQKIHVLSEMNKSIACAVDLAKKDLMYAPTISLREGMRRSIEWMIKSGQEI